MYMSCETHLVYAIHISMLLRIAIIAILHYRLIFFIQFKFRYYSIFPLFITLRKEVKILSLCFLMSVVKSN